MDNKNFFRALFWALLVFLLWQIISIRIWPPPKPTPQPEGPATAANTQGSTNEPQNTPSTASPTSQPETTSQPATMSSPDAPKPEGTLTAIGADTVQSIVLGSTNGFEDSPYRMAIQFCNLGASISSADLSDHKISVDDITRYSLLEPVEDGRPDGAEPWRSMAIDRVTIAGEMLRLHHIPWKAVKREGNGYEEVEFSATIVRGDQPILELVRTFKLSASPAEALRFDLDATLSVRNLTDQPIQPVITERGAVGMRSEGKFRPDRKVYAASMEDYFHLAADTVEKVAKKPRQTLFEPEGNQKLLWVASGNLYFSCTVCPVDAEGKDDSRFVVNVVTVDLDDDPETDRDATTWLSQQVSLDPSQQQVLYSDIYLGPKDRTAFVSKSNEDYLRRNYLAQIKENYGSCTFNFLTDIMIRMLNWFESIVHNFGVAIIILVIIVRAILHPVTKKTQVNMVKMQQNMATMQPKVEAAKKKFANDKARMQQEMMKIYREEGINPLGQMMTCLPMALQMPIWIALYSSLSNNVAMRGRGFCLWINDLTVPDILIPFGKTVNVPLLGEMTGFHLLPLLVGGFMFAQQKLMPKPNQPAATSSNPQAEQAAQMQKMMPYMSLVMIFLFYKFPSGLNLYIMTSSIFGTLEQWYIRNHIKKNGNASPTAPAAVTKPKKKSGPSWFEKLQKQAEEAQKTRSKRDH